MEPVFTLSYSEFSAAQQLSRLFPATKGYSLYVPLSRQEKGVDLILARRVRGRTHTAAIQVKSSRTYSLRGLRRAAQPRIHDTFFNRFDAPKLADFVLLVAVFPSDVARSSREMASWWSTLVLVFSTEEMRAFIRSVKTVGGKPDGKFGFGFDEPVSVIQTRGDQHRRYLDFSGHTLANRARHIREFLTRKDPSR